MAKEKTQIEGYVGKGLLRMHQFPVTSSVYWDIRFLTDWENLNGRDKRHFLLM
jgi:hypothetical protein